ncbi:hypothetical protein EZ437_17090 [Pedobacter psychroterrae]|uniref:HNH endonuclease n=1 Tax=Pedobacter psychroterrae TaxID=2530453 RepID=A0A4R0NLP6_9SPHI|nr:hypothetical protein EZ437_17090 [Pedobacter psychroterrae]
MNKLVNVHYQRLNLKNKYRRFTSDKVMTNDTNEIESIELFHGSYGSLLFDPMWRSKRISILERDKHQCINCKSQIGLQVHHRQYHFSKATNQFKMPWEYADNLLITLCEKCHQKGHKQYKVPTISI